MSLSIGELAERLRVTSRTLRHYHRLGLLIPEHVDSRTGYRRYGEAQLVRGIHIEQLKATGLSLSDIGDALDSIADSGIHAVDALDRRRKQIEAHVAEHARQLALIDALVTSPIELATAAVVGVPAGHAVVIRTSGAPHDLEPAIRHAIQQLRRRVRQRDGVRCRSFSARFPLAMTDDAVDVEVAGHVDAPTSTSVLQPPEARFQLCFVGPLGLLPMAYDAALTAARGRGLQLSGSVVEHYLDMGPVGRTELGFPLGPRPSS